MQDLYTTFGADGVMHCWTAVMLRRRIVVYGKPEASTEIQRMVRALPQLAWQRGPDVGVVVPGVVSVHIRCAIKSWLSSAAGFDFHPTS